MTTSPDVLGVVGLGTIGTALARRAALAGLTVVGLEPDAALLGRAHERLRHSLARAVETDSVPAEEASQALTRIRLTTRWEELADAATVVEAVPERRAAKVEVLRAIHAACPPDTVLATSASALSITELAAASGRSDRLVGLHLPLPTAQLAEIGRTVIADPAAVDRVRVLAERLGLREATVGDRAGLVSTALLFLYLNQAATMYDQGIAGRDDIDAAMRFGCGLPLGPFETLDLIGTDTACDILDALAERLGEPALEPARRLRHMALAGLHGHKTGRGFYDYADGSAPTARPAPTAAPVPTVRTVGVVGAGTMARGIAEVFAAAGIPTALVARSEARATEAVEAITASLGRRVRRGRLTEAASAAALERLTAGDDLGRLADCDLVVEAVAEDLEVKRGLFAELGRLCGPDTLLATTTSSLPVIECGLASGRPADVIGLHFFNPAPLMRLVEVIPSLETTPQNAARALELCRQIGKHPVQCVDRPGFIVNALLFPYLNAAVRMVESDYADADRIDEVMKLGCGYPLGPLELLDVIGLDVSLSIQQILYDADRRPGSAPAPLLTHLVAAGRAGRKSGAGFRVHG